MNSFASRAAHQVVWGQSFCEALVVFQPINPLHIFNRVKCVAGEVHWLTYGPHQRGKLHVPHTPCSTIQRQSLSFILIGAQACNVKVNRKSLIEAVVCCNFLHVIQSVTVEISNKKNLWILYYTNIIDQNWHQFTKMTRCWDMSEQVTFLIWNVCNFPVFHVKAPVLFISTHVN